MEILKIFIPILILFQLPVYGQADYDLSTIEYNENFYDCIDDWAMFKGRGKIHYCGFIVLDQRDGFYYRVHTMLKDKNGRYIIVPSQSKKPFYIPIFSTLLVKKMPVEIREQLNLPEKPDWYLTHKLDTNMVFSLVNTGYHLNKMKLPNQSLEYLEKAYEIDPKERRLAFELAYSHNAIKDFTNSKKILNEALVYDSTNYLLFKELGYAYVRTDSIEKAEETYKMGIKYSDSEQMSAEMAFDLAQAYYFQGLIEKYDFWLNEVKNHGGDKTFYYKKLLKIDKLK